MFGLPQFARTLCLFLTFSMFTLNSLAAPVKARPAGNFISTRSHLKPRQGLATVAEIASIAEDVLAAIKDVVEFITDIDDAEHQAESDFTQNMVSSLEASYPTSNIMVVTSDEDYSWGSYENMVSTHQECDIGLGFTRGYDIFVFDSGTFELGGDGGFINWCFGGSYDYEDGDSVTFYSISS